MFKTTIKIKALQPLHCGSDNQNTGNIKLNRREPFLVRPVEYLSKFASEKEAKNALSEILLHLWNEIPSEIRMQRKASIYDEFYSAITVSSVAGSISSFLEKFCAKFGIRGIDNTTVFAMLQLFEDFEFLHLLRTETQYLFLQFRYLKEKLQKEKIQEAADAMQLGLPSFENRGETTRKISNSIQLIPVISGNSVRHTLRDLAMMYFFKEMGLVGKLGLKEYYEYFSGGALSDSTGKIDIKKQLQDVYMCPPIGLFGTAKGSYMIEGALNISNAIPECLELETGEISHWELTSFVFGTRSDIAKSEKRMKIEGNDSDKKAENPQQMLYWTESIIAGANLNIGIALEPIFEDMELLKSCLYHTLLLLKESGYIGGKSSVAHGQIAFDMPDFDGVDSNRYLSYLETKKEEIGAYFLEKQEKGKK